MSGSGDRYTIPLLLLLTLLMILTGAVDLAQDIGRPYGGLLTYYNPITNSINVSADIPVWWPGLAPGKVERHDALVEIDGVPYTLQSEIESYAAALAESRKSVKIVVDRDGSRHAMDLPVVIFSLNDYLNLKLPSLLISLGFWLIGFTVYAATRASLETVGRVLILFVCCLSIFFGINRPSLYWHDGWVSKLSDIVTIIQGGFVGIALLHFALVFPRPLLHIRGFYLFSAYSFGVLIVGVYLVSRWLLWTQGHSSLVAQLDRESFYMIWRLVAIGAGALTLRTLWMALDPNSQRRQRREGTGLLLGILLAAPFTWSSILNALATWSGYYYWNYIDLRFLFLAMPASFAIVTLRYQTFRSSPPILIIVPLLAISGFIASVGSSVLFSTYPEILEVNRFSVFGVMLVATTGVSLLWSSQSTWRGLFGKLFYWEVHNYNAIKRFNQRLIHQWDIAGLPEAVCRTLCDELELEQAALWLWETSGETLFLASHHGDWTKPPPRELTLASHQTMTARPMRVHTEIGSTGEFPYAEHLPASVQIAIPLIGADSPLGLLALGRRWDKASYDEEDLGILEIIGMQTSLYLLAAIQIEKLQRVPYQLYKVQESEREKIAEELHDTIQQFLGRLPFYLEVTFDTWKEQPKTGEVMLLQRIDEIENAAHTLRNIRNDLAPLIIQTGTREALHSLTSQFSQLTNVQVHITVPAEIDALLSIEARHALYRVVQQALDNIAVHARADSVAIQFAYEESSISFRITDNGVGFSQERREQAMSHGQVGLSSMQRRIEAIGGVLEINSELGTGTTIFGSVPIHV